MKWNHFQIRKDLLLFFSWFKVFFSNDNGKRLRGEIDGDWDVDEDFTTVMVQALVRASILLKEEGHLSLDVFSNRVVEK